MGAIGNFKSKEETNTRDQGGLFERFNKFQRLFFNETIELIHLVSRCSRYRIHNITKIHVKVQKEAPEIPNTERRLQPVDIQSTPTRKSA